jgi:hypothetical protein
MTERPQTELFRVFTSDAKVKPFGFMHLQMRYRPGTDLYDESLFIGKSMFWMDQQGNFLDQGDIDFFDVCKIHDAVDEETFVCFDSRDGSNIDLADDRTVAISEIKYPAIAVTGKYVIAIVAKAEDKELPHIKYLKAFFGKKFCFLTPQEFLLCGCFRG